MKKILLILTALVMALNFLPAFAAENTDEWVFADDGKTILSYNGKSGNITIPEGSVIDNKLSFISGMGIFSDALGEYIPVTSVIVEKGAKIKNIDLLLENTIRRFEFFNNAEDINVKFFNQFSGSDKLEYIRLPEGLTNIPYRFCAESMKLKTVVLPESINEIKEQAFFECRNLTNINLGNNVEAIGSEAFRNCKALDVEIPKNLKSIGDKAFYGCDGLKEIYISDAIMHIGDDAFFACDNVTTVTLPETVDFRKIYFAKTVKTINYRNEKSLDFFSHVKNTEWIKNNYYSKYDFFIIDGHLIKYSGKDKNPIIPKEAEYIDDWAFANQSVENVQFHDGIKEIGKGAFRDCTKIKSVTIPESVKIIGEDAFSGCSSLSELNIKGDSIIGGAAFAWTGLTKDSIHLADGVKYEGVEKDIEYPSDPLIYLYPWYKESENMKKPIILSTPDPKSTFDPKSTPDPKPTPAPKSTLDPRATSVPTASPTAKVLEVSNNGELKITADGKTIEFTDAKPFIDEHSRTQLPVRMIAETVGETVEWKGDTKTVHISGGGKDISLVIGSDVMKVNGGEVKMDTAAVIVNDRTFVPIRYLAEALGYEVHYGDNI